jgi:hypothetical protein
MPERNFRYVGPDRVEAWKAVGWRVIGWTRSPHDGKFRGDCGVADGAPWG